MNGCQQPNIYRGAGLALRPRIHRARSGMTVT